MNQGTSKTNKILLNFEKISIGLLFAFIFGCFLLVDKKELKEGNLYLIILGLETILLVYYIYATKNLYSLFLAGFVFISLGFYVNKTNENIGTVLLFIGEASRFAFGTFLIYKTYLESLKNKDWEMFGTLIALGFLFPLIYHLFLTGNELVMVYNFAFAFIIGTVIYNENLWDKYNGSEKIIIMYALVITLVEVLLISIKLI